MKTSVAFAAASQSAKSPISTKPSNTLFRGGLYFALVMIGILLTGVMPSRAGAQTAIAYEPEIVRLSYIQGDVRLSRGGKNGADLNTSWELAQTNVPMEEGFT